MYTYAHYSSTLSRHLGTPPSIVSGQPGRERDSSCARSNYHSGSSRVTRPGLYIHFTPYNRQTNSITLSVYCIVSHSLPCKFTAHIYILVLPTCNTYDLLSFSIKKNLDSFLCYLFCQLQMAKFNVFHSVGVKLIL